MNKINIEIELQNNYIEFSKIIIQHINGETLNKSILKTLLYYDIFSHPLSGDEIFTFLPQNSVTKQHVKEFLANSEKDGAPYAQKNGLYYIKPNEHYVANRIEKEIFSKKVWKAAWLATHVIKRFPFVRCVMITGTLSKNSSDKDSDLDFFIITAPKRLWIARSLLMFFKKIFLLNSKKYFCINYCITEDNLKISKRNIFTATEIATIKSTYNKKLAGKFIESNSWIKDYFPNYILKDESLHRAGCRVQNRRSLLQLITEIFFTGAIGDKTDIWLMNKTKKYWMKKYPQFNEAERSDRLKTERNESKVHPGSVQGKILDMYREKLLKYNLLLSLLPFYFCLFTP